MLVVAVSHHTGELEHVRVLLPPDMRDRIFILDNELLVDNDDVWGAPLQALLRRVCKSSGEGRVVLIASRGTYPVLLSAEF